MNRRKQTRAKRYTRFATTELDQVATALHNLYKDEGMKSLCDTVGPTMCRHIKKLLKFEQVGPKLAIEIALKLHTFVQ